MSHASALRDRLVAAVAPLLTSPNIPHSVRKFAADVKDDDDFLEAATGAGLTLIALEGAAVAAAGRAKALRAVLAEVLDEAGAPSIALGHHTMSVISGRQSVVVTDPDAVPRELCRTVPDKRLIAEAMAAGIVVPGATIGNGSPGISIRATKR